MDNKRLGSTFSKGLDALFTTKNADQSIENVFLTDIKIANWQPRSYFDEDYLKQLSDSIKNHGVISPILVKKIENDKYEIVAGERRFRASLLAEKLTIPCIILNQDEQKLLEISLIENLQRQDLNAVEKSDAFKFLIDKFNLSHEELGKKLGMSRSSITNHLRLQNLSAEVKEKIAQGKISFSHAKLLMKNADSENLTENLIKAETMSVHKIANSLKNNLKNDKQNSSLKNANKSEIARFKEIIESSLKKYQVDIELNADNSGVLKLSFSNLKDLEDLMDKLCF